MKCIQEVNVWKLWWKYFGCGCLATCRLPTRPRVIFHCGHTVRAQMSHLLGGWQQNGSFLSDWGTFFFPRTLFVAFWTQVTENRSWILLFHGILWWCKPPLFFHHLISLYRAAITPCVIGSFGVLFLRPPSGRVFIIISSSTKQVITSGSLRVLQGANCSFEPCFTEGWGCCICYTI